jgi:3-phytase/alkaline phosphatase D
LDGKLYVGTENALTQDGPIADVGQASPARILVFDAASGERLAEHVYVVEAVAESPPLPGLYRTNGLVELLGGNGMLLALERRYVMGVGNGARIYRLDLTSASDVRDRPALASLPHLPYTLVRKTLLLDLGALGIALENLEGMSWGPRLPSGERTLILVSDDNFSGFQSTQFLAFALDDQSKE